MRTASRSCSAAFGVLLAGAAVAAAPASDLDAFVAALVEEEREHLREDGGRDDAGLRADVGRFDLDNDGRMDFVLTWRGAAHCGENGCRIAVFAANAPGAKPPWRKVYEFSGGPYRIDSRRTQGFAGLRHDAFKVGGRRIDLVARWQGDAATGRYVRAAYDDGGITSTILTGAKRSDWLAINGATVRAAPRGDARALGRIEFGKGVAVHGRVEGQVGAGANDWYLVKTGDDAGGYVPGRFLKQRE